MGYLKERRGYGAFVVLAPFALFGCTMETADDTGGIEFGGAEQDLTSDIFSNPTGQHRTLTVNGATPDENNPFFQNLGVNGRRCVNCHQPSAAMGITPVQIEALFNATQGLDPLFRLNDGANGPLARVGTLEERRAAYSLVRTKGLIRIPIVVPANRDFDIRVVLNPYANTGANPPQNTTVPAGQAVELSFYRRPLLSANTRFISAVMWDGREATVNPVPPNLRDDDGNGVQAFESDAPVRINMLTQSNNATLGHAEGVNPLSAAVRASITDFQMNLVTAQLTDRVAGSLNAAGASGGPAALRTQQTYFGINDSHGGDPFNPAVNLRPTGMTMFSAWLGLTGTAQNNRRAQIARGERLFNTKTIRISGVRGVNDALGVPVFDGSCTTCHTHPNVGNHTDILPLDLGLIKPSEGDNVLPVFRITNRATGAAEEVTDLGRAAITGRFADLGKMKGPTLRALSARPPFFHHGAADNLTEVIQFYDRRFAIGFTAQEIADLRGFLEAL
jgi:cytochrome c peroxidase